MRETRGRSNRQRLAADSGPWDSEAKYRCLVESIGDLVITIDLEGNILFANAATRSLTGREPGEVVGHNIREYVHPEDLPAVVGAMDRVLRGEAPQAVRGIDTDLEFRVNDRWGELVWVASRTPPVRDDRGNIVGFTGIIRDISERRKTEAELLRKEQYFRAITENAPGGIVVLNRDATVRYESPSMRYILGREPEDHPQSSALDYVHPEDIDSVNEALGRLVEDASTPVSLELRVQGGDGSWRYLEAYGKNLLDDPAVQGIVVNFRDITERREAESASRRQERYFRALIEKAMDVIVIIRRDGTIGYISGSIRRVLGYESENLVGTEGFPFVHPGDMGKATKAFNKLMEKENATVTVELRVRHGDGSWRVVECVATNLLDDPDVQGIVVNYRDITEPKEAEETLRNQEKYFRTLIENSLEVIQVLNPDGKIRYESPSVRAVSGYSHMERLGKSILELVHPDDAQSAADDLAKLTLSPGAVFHRELRGKHKDGGWRHIEASGRNLIDDPYVQGIVINYRDISDRKKAEERLQQLYEEERQVREKLEAEMKRRVEFTRALAHELKTPLTSVLASGEALLEKLKDEPLLGLARNISRGAANLDHRIDELLDLAKGEVGMLELKCEPVNLLQLLRDAADNMRPVADNQSQSLSVDLPSSLPLVVADPARLQQVLGNLLSNALKFTPREGRVRLRARRKGTDVVVEVQDTGPGIPKEEQAKLFEPYHRLEGDKDRLGGLGLGLALSKTLVELHGGQIWVKSQAGKGSIFGFTIPSGVRGAEQVGPESVGKLWKVLIIEDDQEIIDSIALTFQMDWPEAELLSSRLGEEGIDLVESEEPDVVILDLGLPDISGFEVLRRIRLFSSVPIVILTVRAEEADIIRGLEWGADDYVAKPFRQKELLARLKVQLRKQAPADEEAPIAVGSLRLDPTTFQLTYGTKEISLTIIEGRIMQCLMKNAGHVVPHSRLAEAVWGEDYPGALDSLRVYIGYLRAKLETDPSSPKLIRTKAGVGYSLVKPAWV